MNRSAVLPKIIIYSNYCMYSFVKRQTISPLQLDVMLVCLFFYYSCNFEIIDRKYGITNMKLQTSLKQIQTDS